MDKTKNVFISHHHADDEHVQKLKDLLSKKGYTLKNSSVDSSKPNRLVSDEAIKRLLRMRIQWAGTFICLIGHETHTRDWVDWEIDQAYKKGKKIVGVFLNGAGEADVPEQFKLRGDALVGWTSEKIIEAIEGEPENWENPDGSPMSISWNKNTSNC